VSLFLCRTKCNFRQFISLACHVKHAANPLHDEARKAHEYFHLINLLAFPKLAQLPHFLLRNLFFLVLISIIRARTEWEVAVDGVEGVEEAFW